MLIPAYGIAVVAAVLVNKFTWPWNYFIKMTEKEKQVNTFLNFKTLNNYYKSVKIIKNIVLEKLFDHLISRKIN
jgi:hypothetical protein